MPMRSEILRVVRFISFFEMAHCSTADKIHLHLESLIVILAGRRSDVRDVNPVGRQSRR
jgi:hypothetical protein